jgi:6-phosphofructokinase
MRLDRLLAGGPAPGVVTVIVSVISFFASFYVAYLILEA